MQRQELKTHLRNMGYKLIHPQDERACSYDSFEYDVVTNDDQPNKIRRIRILSVKGENNYAAIEVNSINESADQTKWDGNDFNILDTINKGLDLADRNVEYIEYLREEYNNKNNI